MVQWARNAAVISLLNANGEVVYQQRGTQAASDELLTRLKQTLATTN